MKYSGVQPGGKEMGSFVISAGVQPFLWLVFKLSLIGMALVPPLQRCCWENCRFSERICRLGLIRQLCSVDFVEHAGLAAVRFRKREPWTRDFFFLLNFGVWSFAYRRFNNWTELSMGDFPDPRDELPSLLLAVCSKFSFLLGSCCRSWPQLLARPWSQHYLRDFSDDVCLSLLLGLVTSASTECFHKEADGGRSNWAIRQH